MRRTYNTIQCKNAEAIYRRPDEKMIKPVAADLSGMGHILFNDPNGDVGYQDDARIKTFSG
jgi:hypothetical protein